MNDVKLRDGDHALVSVHSAVLKLTVLILLQQHRPHQPVEDRCVVEVDAIDAIATFDFLDDPLQQVGGPGHFPMVLSDVAASKNIFCQATSN
jgi:hypothetical protein